MDPAIATIDLVKAGAIVASMVESYLAAAVPPLNAKGADDDDGQNNTGAAPVTDGLRLHPTIDAGAGPLQSGEHRTPVQSGSQSAVAWMEPTADPRPRSRPRAVWLPDSEPRGLQVAGQRRGDGQCGGDLLAGGLPPSAVEPGLAPASR